MPKWAGAVLVGALIVLFLIADRGAYEGYFQGDDLDNLAWTRSVSIADFAQGLASPLFFTNNFRPVGHLYYFLMGRAAGLDFRWYVAVLHAVHLLNVWLVWLLLRRLKLAPLAATAGAVLFAFHMAVFDAYWKPMYIFDVLCAAFCLLSLLAYTRGRLVLSFLSFWLAYKAKEVAVMLPLILAAYELWLGERKWKRLIPFFAVSLLFGLQGIFRNPHKEITDEYTMRFTPAAVWKSIRFYSSGMLLVPYAGLGLVALPLFVRDRRLYFGVASAAALMTPMLFLPGRLYGAYLYVPLLGVAVAFAAFAAQRHWAPLAIFFALWLPANYMELRVNRRRTLAEANQNRRYVEMLGDFFRSAPDTRGVVFDGTPPGLRRWGVEGAIRYLAPRGNVEIRSAQDADAYRALRFTSVAMLSWDPAAQKLYTMSRSADSPEASYIAISRAMAIWQLGEGWYQIEDRYRWIRPRATARLRRPASVTHFELVVNVGPGQIQDIGRTRIEVRLNDKPLGAAEFSAHGWQTVRWELPPAEAGPVDVEFRVEPEYHPSNLDPRTLGIPIAAFGFVRR